MRRTHERIMWSIKEIKEVNIMLVKFLDNFMVDKVANDAINLARGIREKWEPSKL